jgi:hypothetical protein
MIVTARQLEDLHRQSGANGTITLPYRARLSPLAQDWVRSKKIALGYSDIEKPANGNDAPPAPVSGLAQQAGCGCGGHATGESSACNCPTGAGGFLWWCDGPCGPAKAALTALSKESSLRAMDVPSDVNRVTSVVKSLAADVRAGRVAGGLLLVQSGAAATLYANRCPSLRAVLGTCLEAVEQGVQQVAANVLIVEYPYKTLQQMKNMLGRFVKAKRELSEDVRRQLQELTTCG